MALLHKHRIYKIRNRRHMYPQKWDSGSTKEYPVQHGDRLEGRVAALPEVGRHAVARIADQRDARPRHRQMTARNENEPQLGERVHELIRSHSNQFENDRISASPTSATPAQGTARWLQDARTSLRWAAVHVAWGKTDVNALWCSILCWSAR